MAWFHVRSRIACFVFSLCVTLLFVASTTRAQMRHGMTPAETLRVANVADAQISPDGEWVVYTVTTIERDATHTALWIARTATNLGARPVGTNTAPLLAASWNATTPRWSPDSKRIAFLASQDGQRGIRIVSLNERQPRFVAPVRETNFFITYAGESFAWSPDSKRIAFISASESDNAMMSSGDGSSNVDGNSNSKGDDPRVIDRIQYKSRTSFSDRLRTHVWLVDVDAPERERIPRQLTSGAFYDHALSWNPRGDEIAFLSNHEPDPDASNNSDIFAVDTSGHTRQITTTRGCEYEPAWSPDGKFIAYTATKRDVTTIDSVAEDAHVWVIDADGTHNGRELTAAQDRRARSPRWSLDSRSILFLAGDRGRTLVYRVGIEGGEARSVIDVSVPADRLGTETSWPPFQIGSFGIANVRAVSVDPTFGRGSASRTILALTISDALHPAELWFYLPSLRSGAFDLARRISQHNDALVRSVSLIEPEEIRFKSFDGTPNQGWLMKPAGWREGQRYPLILSVHGGPHGAYGYAFNPTFQAYAARGYAVLYLNPRGSSGYGQKFSDGTLHEWGGGDYRDLMQGVDEVLRTRTWIDPDRMGVTGGSYGGFMTNWIITQTPRFKAAVASASVSNLISFYATSLYQDLIHAEFGGAPWDDYDQLWRWSPLRYVKQVETPTLFIHGEQDNDVHITQAEEMYMALKRRGIETVMVRYPHEGHGLREPRHRVDALERTLAWFDKFLK
jgi:dipeptidyl aminopeptidase/acylaminoacyl peptidase